MVQPTNPTALAGEGALRGAMQCLRGAFASSPGMLPVMMRALADAWRRSGGALDRASDAMDRNQGPSARSRPWP